MVLDRFLFPVPEATYTMTTFPTELLAMPMKERPDKPHPALLLHPTYGAAKFLVIYMHGNATDLGHMEDEMRHLAEQLSCAVLMPEYPGYGPFKGTPSFSTINDAAWATFRFARDVMEVPSGKIVLYGRSIGTGVVSRLAYRAASSGERVGGVCLVSPYTNIINVVKTHVGFLSNLFAHRWQPDKDLPRAEAPVLLLHGNKDTLITPDNSLDLLRHVKRLAPLPALDRFVLYPAESGPLNHAVAVQISSKADHNSWAYTQDLLVPTVRFVKEVLKLHHGSSIPDVSVDKYLYSSMQHPPARGSSGITQCSCFM